MTEPLINSVLNEGMTRWLVKEHQLQCEQFRKFYLGYSEAEEAMWLRFNRCCHEGRKIRLMPRPVVIRMGKPTVSVRRPAPFEASA